MTKLVSGPFGGSSAPDSARMNLAAAFVNGFVNCGFGVDKMMAESEEASRWFYKNKDFGGVLYFVKGTFGAWPIFFCKIIKQGLFVGMLSAAASQGLVWRWDIDSGLAQCDRFLYVNEDFIKVGLYWLRRIGNRLKY